MLTRWVKRVDAGVVDQDVEPRRSGRAIAATPLGDRGLVGDVERHGEAPGSSAATARRRRRRCRRRRRGAPFVVQAARGRAADGAGAPVTTATRAPSSTCMLRLPPVAVLPRYYNLWRVDGNALGRGTRARVWRAIISSSWVGTTRRATRLAGVEMRVAPAALAAGSSSAPSQARRSAMRARIGAACSPMPAVKTKASRPPRAAASSPTCRPQRCAKWSSAKRRRGRRWRAGRACRWRRRRGPSAGAVVEQAGDLGRGHPPFLDQVAGRRRDRAGPGGFPWAGRRGR